MDYWKLTRLLAYIAVMVGMLAVAAAGVNEARRPLTDEEYVNGPPFRLGNIDPFYRLEGEIDPFGAMSRRHRPWRVKTPLTVRVYQWYALPAAPDQ